MKKNDPKRPKPRAVGDLRLQVMRGPREEDGRWYWRARAFRDGTEHTAWTGWATIPEADAAAASIVAAGKVYAPREPDRADTIRDLCELFVGKQEGRGDIEPVTLITTRNMLRRVVASIGEVRVERLDGATLERHRDTRLRAGAAGSSIKAELVRLRAAWTWGQEIGLVPARSLPRIRIPIEPRNCQQTPTRGDQVSVLQRLEGWIRLAVLLYASTGARLSELADLTWSAVDLDRAEITVKGKTGRRVVPCAPPMVRELRAWRDAHPETVPEGRVWGVGASTVKAKIRPALMEACEAAGVPRFTAQGLRRAAVDALYRSGVDPAAAASVVGHSPAVALAAYRRATQEDRRQAVHAARLGYLDEPEVLQFPVRHK